MAGSHTEVPLLHGVVPPGYCWQRLGTGARIAALGLAFMVFSGSLLVMSASAPKEQTLDAVMLSSAATSDTEAAFNKAAADVRNLKTTPTSDELLKLYGLYKQALFGDNPSAEPWSISFREHAKWEAWMKVKGTSKEDAMKQYVALEAELEKEYGTN
mmetsp:Transcript_78316/g.155159  ORF Transcript_78316/g.155159 Transcript_78316/m.155159 type:complete len:157 (-) Transcript_78316:166-636(-)